MRSTSFGFLFVIVGMAGAAMADDGSMAAPIDTTALEPTRPATTADVSMHESGNASFYSHRLKGHRTASGQPYDPGALTAAHRTLPLGTRLEVVNPKNDRHVVVTVNDRGPVRKNRVLDVSSAATDALDMKRSGVTHVRTRVLRGADGHVDRAADATIDDEATMSTGPSAPTPSTAGGSRR